MDILRKNGIRGLYRGLVPTALRDFGYGAYFATASIYVISPENIWPTLR